MVSRPPLSMDEWINMTEQVQEAEVFRDNREKLGVTSIQLANELKRTKIEAVALMENFLKL